MALRLLEKVRDRLSRRPRIGLALSGGGCKAFFGLGVGQVLLENGVPIRVISGASAGAAMAFTLVSGRTDKIVQYYYSITLRNPQNFYFSRLLRGRRPFPHERMYRRAIITYLDYELIMKSRIDVAINALLLPPDIYPPSDALKRTRLLARLVGKVREDATNSKRGIFRQVLPNFAREAGLVERVFRREDFTSQDQVEDIVLASSSVPMLLAFQRMRGDGNYYLDGGLTRNIPVAPIADECDLIVAVYYENWSRRQLILTGEEKGNTLVYVKPDSRLPITTWDYANPNGVREAYDMGRRAGEKTVALLNNIM